MFLVTIWWFVSAKKWFKGPKVNVQHMMLGRGEVVVGQEGEQIERDSASDEKASGEKMGHDKV